MKTLAFFNNKGGVGKTTLICNLAYFLASKEQKRVLLIDLDPQCNSTQLLLSPDACAQMYWPEADAESSVSTAIQTIYDAVRPLEEGEGSTIHVLPVPAAENRFSVDVLPGHPRMSVFEDQLGQWFRDATAGDVAGLRKTLWLRTLVQQYDEYDVILFDVGPSLGSLNRSVLAAADYFVTPMGADIFSVVALRNIAEWITSWNRLYESGIVLCGQRNPGAVERYDLPKELDVKRGFAGFTVQQYSTVSIRGERRATIAYEEIINKIPAQVDEHLAGLASPGLAISDLSLGDVPNLRSLVPLAQSANAPLAALTARDGITGGQYSQQKSYSELINIVGSRITENCFSE